MDNVEKVARALASADGLDWDEVCGVDDPATEGFCDSGTCIAAHWEDHDQEQARRWYLHLARSALVAIDPVALVRAGIDAAYEAVQYCVNGYPLDDIRALSAADVLKEMMDELPGIIKDRIIALEADVARLREALEICLEELYAPDPNCSCHICAPCGDCVEYNSIREARELALAALEARND